MSDYPLLILGNLSAGPQLLERLNPTVLDIYSRLGTAVASCTEWLEGGLTPTYVDDDEFSLAGDATGIFPAGRMVRATLDAGYVHEAVLSSSYDDVAEVTTVTLASGVLDSTLDGVSLGILAPGADSALPTIIGKVRTFTSFPLGPSAAPTSDYEFANKKFVDDAVDGAVASAGLTSTQPGFIEGCACEGNGDTTFNVHPGRVVVDGLLCTIPSVLLVTHGTLSAGTWYYLHAQKVATLTVANMVMYPTPGTWDESKQGFYQGGHRMIGVLRTKDGSGDVAKNSVNNGYFSFNESVPRFYGAVMGSTALTAISVDVPALGRLVCDIDASIYKSGTPALATFIYNGDGTTIAANMDRGFRYSQNITANSQQFSTSFRIVTNGSQQLKVAGQTNEYIYLACNGFELPRSLGRD